MRGALTWTWLTVAAAGACYSPRPLEDCDVTCSAAAGDRCPDGFSCGASGLCSIGGAACPGDMGAGICFGASIARPCVPSVPPGVLTLSGDLDTDADGRCVDVMQPSSAGAAPSLCVIAGEQIVIGGRVHATGKRPLVLVARETITVGAPLDARSVRGQAAGAGAGPCPTPGGGTAEITGSGGAGGSFQGRGGAGGAITDIAGATPLPPMGFPDHVRGGCPGGLGGEGTSVPARAGAGGGALYLIANRSIDVQDVIAANGAGALLQDPNVGAARKGGGGGGGAGGMIVLEAPLITFGSAARLLAMGGGGAGGGGEQDMSEAGGDPDPTAMAPADITARGGRGGMPLGTGGLGGDGSSPGLLDGSAGTDGAMGGGGGGGGGGAGFIRLICTTCNTDETISIPRPNP